MPFTPNQLRAILPRLKIRAARICYNESDRDDLIQNTIIRMWEYKNQFNGDSIDNLRRWAFVIMRRIHFDDNASKKRREELMKIEPLTNTIEYVYNNIASSAPGPDSGLWTRDALKAFSRLPLQQQKSLIDTEMFGEIKAAELANVPRGTIKSRNSRGREALKQFNL